MFSQTAFSSLLKSRKKCIIITSIINIFRTMIPIYLDHVPAGSSLRPFVHYAQLSKLNQQFRDH